MESIISTFHINWQIMVAQLVNFLIVALVLWFFALKPLSAKMDERSKTINKSLEEAKVISKKLQETEIEKETVLKKAQQEAGVIISRAQALAEAEREATLKKVRAEAEKVIKEGKEHLADEKERVIKAINAEAADLVIGLTEKVLIQVSEKKINKKVISDTVKQLK